jgi:NADPH2:quinone reductase
MTSGIPKTMQAIVYDDYGTEEVLHLREVETPSAKDGQVVIQVHAASVNPIDYRIRSGEIKVLLPGGFPRIPGYEVAEMT